ncbi:MAG TPA: hypothetical protein DHW77_03700 [Verrucomicrobiales bacterium]|nr:hypothetical protein [Verrucomicrobiales bacterium]
MLSASICAPLLFGSCSSDHPNNAPTKKTPTGAKVNLSGVSLTTSKATIHQRANGIYELQFDYTITNSSASNIEFPCLYASIDDLIEVNLSDQDNDPIALGSRPLEGLTLTQPRPRRISVGETTRSYSVPIIDTALEAAELVNIRIRLHVPSRYDELRNSLEARSLALQPPSNEKQEKP